MIDTDTPLPIRYPYRPLPFLDDIQLEIWDLHAIDRSRIAIARFYVLWRMEWIVAVQVTVTRA